MGKTYYMLSDLHGTYKPLETTLNKLNLKEDYLVVLGDMINKGKDSYKIVTTLMRLEKIYGKDKIIVLKGNHDEMLLDWLENDFTDYLIRYLKPTLNSFYKGLKMSPVYDRKTFRKTFKKEIKWFKSLRTIYETKHMVAVHGGLDFTKKRPTDSDDDTRMNIRYWWEEKNPYNKLIVFGHTPVINIKGNHSPYYSPKNKVLGIDSSACITGEVHVAVVKKGKLKDVKIFR